MRGYSRFISIVKIVLPLIALGLLATVFLFTKDNELEGGFRFSKTDLETLESGMQVMKPRLFGSNPSGDVYNFVADSLAPDSLTPSLLTADQLSGEIQFLSGTAVQMTAKKAEFLLEGKAIRLSDGMLLVTSDGIRITGEGLLANLDTGELDSDGSIEAVSAMGRIQAGNFRIERIEADGEEKQMLWFENGVMLSFRPENWENKKAITE